MEEFYIGFDNQSVIDFKRSQFFRLYENDIVGFGGSSVKSSPMFDPIDYTLFKHVGMRYSYRIIYSGFKVPSFIVYIFW